MPLICHVLNADGGREAVVSHIFRNIRKEFRTPTPTPHTRRRTRLTTVSKTNSQLNVDFGAHTRVYTVQWRDNQSTRQVSAAADGPARCARCFTAAHRGGRSVWWTDVGRTKLTTLAGHCFCAKTSSIRTGVSLPVEYRLVQLWQAPTYTGYSVAREKRTVSFSTVYRPTIRHIVELNAHSAFTISVVGISTITDTRATHAWWTWRNTLGNGRDVGHVTLF